MPNKQISLKLVTKPGPDAAIIEKGTPAGTPLFNGTQSEDLLCGSCGGVIVKGMFLNSFANIVVKCDCGAYNLLSSH